MQQFDSNEDESELRRLRANYCKEVKAIAEVAKQIIAGRAEEEMAEEELETIARTVSSLRREIGIKYKDLTPQDRRDQIYKRNIKKYGDSFGPTIEYFRAIGKTWLQIIESASRPNQRGINDILGE